LLENEKDSNEKTLIQKMLKEIETSTIVLSQQGKLFKRKKDEKILPSQNQLIEEGKMMDKKEYLELINWNILRMKDMKEEGIKSKDEVFKYQKCLIVHTLLLGSGMRTQVFHTMEIDSLEKKDGIFILKKKLEKKNRTADPVILGELWKCLLEYKNQYRGILANSDISSFWVTNNGNTLKKSNLTAIAVSEIKKFNSFLHINFMSLRKMTATFAFELVDSKSEKDRDIILTDVSDHMNTSVSIMEKFYNKFSRNRKNMKTLDILTSLTNSTENAKLILDDPLNEYNEFEVIENKRPKGKLTFENLTNSMNLRKRKNYNFKEDQEDDEEEDQEEADNKEEEEENDEEEDEEEDEEVEKHENEDEKEEDVDSCDSFQIIISDDSE
jgi:hypothetical protein